MKISTCDRIDGESLSIILYVFSMNGYWSIRVLYDTMLYSLAAGLETNSNNYFSKLTEMMNYPPLLPDYQSWTATEIYL
jgi:hypothetical protein